MPLTDDDALRAVLTNETIAVVGCSTTPGKAAHDVPAYLKQHGYQVIPVNPYAETVLGAPAADDIESVSAAIDVVNVFRPSEEVPAILEAVQTRHEARGDAGTVWLQRGIHHDEATAAAEAAGIDVVSDRCMKVAHRRLLSDA